MEHEQFGSDWTTVTKKSQRNKQGRKGFGFKTSQTLKCCSRCIGSCRCDMRESHVLQYDADGLIISAKMMNKDKRWELLDTNVKVKSHHSKKVKNRDGKDVLVVKTELNRYSNTSIDNKHCETVIVLPNDKKRILEDKCRRKIRDDYGMPTKVQREKNLSLQVDYKL